MEFIFSNSNRQKKSYRDKNSKLVDKKIQHAFVQSDSEFYNATTSVASAPVVSANLRRDKSKRAAQVGFLGIKFWPCDVQENRVFHDARKFFGLFGFVKHPTDLPAFKDFTLIIFSNTRWRCIGTRRKTVLI